MIKKKSPISSFLLAGFILGIGESLFYYKLQLFNVPMGELVSFLVFAGIVDSIVLGIFALLLKLIFRFGFKRKFTPYILPSLALLALLAVLIMPSEKFSGSRSNQPGKGLPNLILITLDTTSAKHLSLYGYQRNTSPNLDRIAQKGIVFDQAISASPWTLASHSTMFTGLLPSDHGATYRSKKLRDDAVTLAEILKDKGYTTAGFISGPYCMREFGISQGFSYYDDQVVSLKGMIFIIRTIDRIWGEIIGLGGSNLIKNVICKLEGYLHAAKRPAEMTNDRIMRFMDKNIDENPFFLFINYFDPHDPYITESPYDTLYLKKYGPNPSTLLARKLSEYSMERHEYYGWKSVPDGFWEEEKPIIELANGLYDGLVYYMDEKLGELMDYLDANGYLDNTYIIITADHGESLGERRMWGHAGLYDEIVWVPLVIIGPGIPEGVRLQKQVSTLDIFNISQEMLGVRSGTSSAEVQHNFTENECNWYDELVFGQFFRDNYLVYLYGEKYDRDSFMSRTGEMKIIYRTNEEIEKYNIIQDKEELNNIVDIETQEYSKLDSLFDEMIEDALAKVVDTEYSISSSASDQLRAVGYVK